MQRLQERVAVITGAGSGIGLACVRRLAAGFPGASGIYVENLATGQAAAWNARATFPAASKAYSLWSSEPMYTTPSTTATDPVIRPPAVPVQRG